MPGDTLEIRNGYFRVNGTDEELGNLVAQEAISHLKGTLDEDVTFMHFRIATVSDGLSRTSVLTTFPKRVAPSP